MTRRVLFYVQHILGIGHVARAARIVAAMSAEGIDVTVVQGGVAVDGMDWGGARLEYLPAIKAGTGGYADLVDEAGAPVSDDLRKARREKLLALCHDANPDVIITEAFPFGRRAMRFELLPMLDEMKARKNPPLIACSIRDILHENRKPELNEKTLRLIDEYFDFILVHGDPEFISVGDSFPLAERIADKTLHTGIVAPNDRTDLEGAAFDIVVSAGGGAVGEALLVAAAQALKAPVFENMSACLVTGPNLPGETLETLRDTAPQTVEIIRFREDFPALLAAAKLSVSQCGYNTSADVLRARCRSVFVPSAYQGETEQTRRAFALKERGVAEVVEESELNKHSLMQAMVSALAGPPPDPERLPKIDGAEVCARLVAKMSRETNNAVA